MIEVSATDFGFEARRLDEQSLKAYATGLFDAWQVWLDEGVRLDDFSVRLEIVQGSVQGRGRIWAAAGVLYFGIGAYADFRQGLREINQDLKGAETFLVDHAVAPFSARVRPKVTRSSQGKVAKLESIFRRVETGQMTTEAASRAALKLFEKEDVSHEFLNEMTTAVCGTHRIEQQMTIEGVQADPGLPELPPAPQRVPTRRPPGVPVPQLEVAVWRETKRGLRKVQVLTR